MDYVNKYFTFTFLISILAGIILSPFAAFAQHESLLKASNVIGMNVLNVEGESLGNIEDLVIEIEKGEATYVLLQFLDFEGFVGVERKYFAVPWKAVKFTPSSQTVVLDVEKKLLHEAKGVDKNSLQELIRQSNVLFSSHQPAK